MKRQIKFRAWDGEQMHYNIVPWQWDFVISLAWHKCEKSTGTGILGSGGPTGEFLVPGIRFKELMQFTDLLDKNGKEIYEGDVVLGEQYYVPSDGYKRKKYPDAIKVICVVEFKRGSFQHPKLIGPAPEYKEAYEMYNYRGIGYWLEPTYKGSRSYNPESGAFDIPGDDQTCETIEVIGNIYENPELLDP